MWDSDYLKSLFSGKRAIITGGSRGIGAAIVQKMSSFQAKVEIIDAVPPAHLQDSTTYISADFTKPQQVAELTEQLSVKAPPPAILICNAGQGIQQNLAEGDPAIWDSIMHTNLLSHLKLIRATAPAMLVQGGDIVFISSVSAIHPYAGGGIYSASKAAVNAAAESLRLELQPNVRVTVIMPGVVDTPFFEHIIDGGHNPETIGWGASSSNDIADAVIFALAMPARSAVNSLTIRPAAQPM